MCPEHLRDALGRLALPLRADEEVETGLGAVHHAEVGKTVCAEVHDLVDPKAGAECRHLHDHWSLVERRNARAVQHILVRTRDPALRRLDVVVQHRQSG